MVQRTETVAASSSSKCKYFAAFVLLQVIITKQVNAFSHTSSFAARSSSSSNTPTFYNNYNKIHEQRISSPTRSTLTALSMVIDRMSEECISATQAAHKIGNEMGLRLLKNEALIAGVANRPERGGRTLAKYNLMYPLVRKSAEHTLQQSGFQLARKVNKDTLTGNDKNLPFSEEVKVTLSNASKIADHFESRLIHSEHVLLALMGYNYGNPIDQLSLSSAFTVLKNAEGLRMEDTSKFSAYDFCEELVQDMIQPYDYLRENPVTEEVVLIGGGATKTNTLEEVGVDLTQMALEGRLDRVYGRDKEIAMALRTLGRRRKNNPCLVGDPGVGKVRASYQELLLFINYIL